MNQNILLHHNIDPNELKNTVELLLLITSSVISFLALRIAFKAYNVDNQHNKISVKPILHPRYTKSTKRLRANFYIENNGLGPLIFEEFSIIYKNKKYDHVYKVIKEINKELINEKGSIFNLYKKNSHSWSLKNYSMKEGTRKVIYSVELSIEKFNTKSEAQKYFKILADEFESVEFHYAYNNVYGEQIKKGEFKYSEIFNDDQEN